MTSRREKEIKFRESLILDAAEKLFEEKGFEKVTLEEIAKKAEYTKPTLYNYFKSKEEIFIGVYLRGWNNSTEKIYQAIAKKEKGFDKLKITAETYNDFFKKHHIYFSLLKYVHSKGISMGGNNTKREKKHKKDWENKLETFEKIISDGIADGSISKEIEPKIATNFFLNNLYINMHTYHNKKDVAEDFLEKATDLMLKVFR